MKRLDRMKKRYGVEEERIIWEWESGNCSNHLRGPMVRGRIRFMRFETTSWRSLASAPFIQTSKPISRCVKTITAKIQGRSFGYTHATLIS